MRACGEVAIAWLAGFRRWFCDRSFASTDEYNTSAKGVEAALNCEELSGSGNHEDALVALVASAATLG